MKRKFKVFLSLFALSLTSLASCGGSCDHDYVLSEYVSEPTCSSGGVAIYSCNKCSESYYQKLDPLGHDYGEIHKKEDSTCDDYGHESYYQCSRCQKVFDANKNETTLDQLKIAPKGHAYNKQVATDAFLATPATCSEKATYFYSCECGDKGHETFEYGNPLGHDYGQLISETNSTCSSRGMFAHYECSRCHTYFNSEKQQVSYDSLLKDIVSHNYLLSQDGMQYECETCKNVIPSGKEEIGMAERKNYIFIGSSITNGYNAQDPSVHYSMADMFENDYINLSYKFHDKNKFITRENIYLRKTSDVSNNTDGVGGNYQYYDDKIMLDGNGGGLFILYNKNEKLIEQEFEYTLKGKYIELKQPDGYLFALFGHFYEGNLVYKHAQDGNSLSEHEKYTADGTLINPTTNYCYRLRDAIAGHKNDHIDTVVIQLSTNDVGNYIDSRGSAGEHVPFGEVSGDNIRNSSDLDTQTSLGALEWLIAKSIETWNCKVVIYTCHMSDGEYNIYKSNNYDLSKVKTAYADLYNGCLKVVEKWGCGIIDLFANKDCNIALHEDHSRCMSDTLHLLPLGYEKVFYQIFRDYCEKLSGNMSTTKNS